MKKSVKNLIGFEDFKKNWKPEKAKNTKRTQTGLDILKEDIDTEKTIEEFISYKRRYLVDYLSELHDIPEKLLTDEELKEWIVKDNYLYSLAQDFGVKI